MFLIESMNNYIFVLVPLLAIIVVFTLLFLGKHHYINSQYEHIAQIWKKVLFQIQYYCDNVPYTLESYRLLYPEDKQRFDKILDSKIKCTKSMHKIDDLNEAFDELNKLLEDLFELRKKDTKIAHDLRFIEAFSEFNNINKNLGGLVEHYNRDILRYETTLNRGMGHVVDKFSKFPSLLTFNLYKKV